MNQKEMEKRKSRWVSQGFAGYLRLRNWAANKAEQRGHPEEGSTTVEYAIGAIATAGFAGLLLVVLKSGGVKSLITGIIESALSI